MTSPPTAPERDWWARPRVMLPALLALLVFVVLLTPEATEGGRIGDDRLSTHLAGPQGARGLSDAAARLGWRVVQRDSTPVPTGAAGHTVHAVLAPPLVPTAAQAHRYLDAVRGGDALLIVLGAKSPLSDSLGLAFAPPGGVLQPPRADTLGCGARGRDRTPSLWIDGRVHLYELRWVRGKPADATTFVQVRDGTSEEPQAPVPAAVGFSLGAGRVVAISDPDLLRNDVLRRCEWGADVAAARMLEWLSEGGAASRGTIEFDEYHQGFGPRASVSAVTGRFLLHHPVGRVILQLVLASLVLLLAVAPRALAPAPRRRTERRDPLEQADALAHAYQQVGATRTATSRLLRAVRSRVERAGGLARIRDDEQFLAHAGAADPALAADVALVQRALTAPRDDDRLPEIGAALRRIEESLTTTTSIRA